jgi:hypothetical protein
MRAISGFLAAITLLVPRLCLAQTAKPAVSPRVFLDLNVVGVGNPLSHERVFTGLFVKSGELETVIATYPQPSASAIVPVDIAGGFFVNSWIAVGGGFSRTSYDDGAAVIATIPHPLILNAPGIGSASLGSLERIESTVHVFVALVPLRTGRFEWRIAGGPSFFHYTAEMVKNVTYTQDAPPESSQNLVTIDGFDTATAKGNGVGVNASTDVAYFLSRQVAITGAVRFSAANVTVDPEPLSKRDQQVRVGGTSFLVGVRFQFGHR